jgi:hypothetical protein
MCCELCRGLYLAEVHYDESREECARVGQDEEWASECDEASRSGSE